MLCQLFARSVSAMAPALLTVTEMRSGKANIHSTVRRKNAGHHRRSFRRGAMARKWPLTMLRNSSGTEIPGSKRLRGDPGRHGEDDGVAFRHRNRALSEFECGGAPAVEHNTLQTVAEAEIGRRRFPARKRCAGSMKAAASVGLAIRGMQARPPFASVSRNNVATRLRDDGFGRGVQGRDQKRLYQFRPTAVRCRQ